MTDKNNEYPVPVSILAFNVFTGTPIAPPCSCLITCNNYGTARLEDSKRLQIQLIEIKRQQPDIILLNEVYSDRVVQNYIDLFPGDQYQAIVRKVTNTRGIIVEFLVYVLCAGITAAIAFPVAMRYPSEVCLVLLLQDRKDLYAILTICSNDCLHLFCCVFVLMVWMRNNNIF